MQATITTFAGFPAAFRRSAKARRTGLHRIAATVDMYSTQRTSARPPQMTRLPRCLPLSLARGARPASAAMPLRSRVHPGGHKRGGQRGFEAPGRLEHDQAERRLAQAFRRLGDALRIVREPDGLPRGLKSHVQRVFGDVDAYEDFKILAHTPPCKCGLMGPSNRSG